MKFALVLLALSVAVNVALVLSYTRSQNPSDAALANEPQAANADDAYLRYQKIFSQDEAEKILFKSPLDPARDGEFRIGIKCVEGIHAELTVYRAENGRYQEVLQCPAVIGMNGPCKQASGDNRTPLGTWTVGAAFGIKEDPGSVIPYTQVTEDHYWRGDGGSPKYNTMVRRSEFPDEDYSDDEHIIEYGSVYNYILDMGFNKPCAPYVGSALFLHCWRGPNQGTHGCVAVAEENMVKILQTITPGTSITIY